MKDLAGKVAVVTGAASGIGFGLAERFAQENMKVVLADIEEAALIRAEQTLRERGAEVIAVRTDVSKEEDIAALARRALDAYGAVHVVSNNAGVFQAVTMWSMTQKDWEWVLNVNLGAVISSIRIFVPIMISQNEGYMINTSSAVGLTTANFGAYSVTKHAIVAASEALHHGLASEGYNNIKVSVLCPVWVRSRLIDAHRNRQPEYRDTTPTTLSPKLARVSEALKDAMANGIAPSEVANLVIQAMAEERFYIFDRAELTPLIQLRFDDIFQDRKPTSFM